MFGCDVPAFARLLPVYPVTQFLSKLVTRICWFIHTHSRFSRVALIWTKIRCQDLQVPAEDIYRPTRKEKDMDIIIVLIAVPTAVVSCLQILDWIRKQRRRRTHQ
jgi:hypothetical protein